MNLRWLRSIGVVLSCAMLFLAGGHLVASALIAAQQQRQLEDLTQVALRRSQAAVDFGAEVLSELAAKGPMDCDPTSLQAVRLHVYEHGAVKDIRAVDGNGTVRCSAYSETLEFDNGWATRDTMLPAANPSLRLFKVAQFSGSALGVMKDIDPRNGLVAILDISGSMFDIMPAELKDRSEMTLELNDGQMIADSRADPARALAGDVVSFSAGSRRYPIRTTLRVERGALAGWDQQPYLPILALAATLGIAFGAILARLLDRPPNPVQELDRAIAAGEFRPYLQAIFDLESGTIVGAEILARWIRADGTVLPPSRFIELAEEAGRIEPITWQLLRQALGELKPTLRRDKTFRISVNISPRHFMAPDFVRELRRLVNEAGVATRQIALEVTEREAFDNLDDAANVVAQVRHFGFKVAIDDVGIGHSGLSQIQRLGADVLKIDKFFVDCIGKDASADLVVEMLARMAAGMAMDVVAEGIELPEQAEALLRCGIRRGQGYLVGPPVPIPAFLAMMAERNAAPSAAGLSSRVA
jgi:sensor c-di-GMP phosphodiesterase-like protein